MSFMRTPSFQKAQVMDKGVFFVSVDWDTWACSVYIIASAFWLDMIFLHYIVYSVRSTHR